MNERENLGVGVYQFLIVGVFIFCLVGAFVLPPSFTSSRILGWIWLVGIVASPFLLISANRSRIRNAVNDWDGILVSMKRVPKSWDAEYFRYPSLCRTRYELEYIDLTGAAHRALCNSGWISGVEWLEDEKVSDGPLPSEID